MVQIDCPPKPSLRDVSNETQGLWVNAFMSRGTGKQSTYLEGFKKFVQEIDKLDGAALSFSENVQLSRSIQSVLRLGALITERADSEEKTNFSLAPDQEAIIEECCAQLSTFYRQVLNALDEHLAADRTALRAGTFNGSELRDKLLGYDALQQAVSCIEDSDVAFDVLLQLPTSPEVSGVIDKTNCGYEPTPIRTALAAFHMLQLKEHDVLYDLGSGLGRIPMLCALTTEAYAKGVEVLPELHQSAADTVERNNIPRVELINTSVANLDLSDGTAFFLSNPFSGETLSKVVEKIGEVAEQKPVSIVCIGECAKAFQGQPWIKSTVHHNTTSGLWDVDCFFSFARFPDDQQ